MKRFLVTSLFVVPLLAATVRGDGLLFSFEGDKLLSDPASGFDVFNPCENDCSERLENGHYLLEWGPMGDFANYSRDISGPGDPPPPQTLWVEWGFRSNQSKPSTALICDGRMRINYRDIVMVLQMFSDVAFDVSGNDFTLIPDTEIFHTYRFESADGQNFVVSLDGSVFHSGFDPSGSGFAAVQPGGDGDCIAGPDRPQPVRNEWDFIRYGTIGSDEQLVSADPPAGNLSPSEANQLSSIILTFDQPAYLYVDDITVTTTGGTPPTVSATRRQDNGAPEVLEVVINGLLPPGETTTFTFDTGTGPQTVSYFREQPEVPAASGWGLLTMSLLALSTGAVVLRRSACRGTGHA